MDARATPPATEQIIESFRNRPLFWGTRGPADAPIVFVGESWGGEENAQKLPFVGESGKLADRILSRAGIQHEQVLFTNVVPSQPPGNHLWKWFYPRKEAPNSPLRGCFPNATVRAGLERLYTQMDAHPRKLIIAVGNYALWALTPHADIGNASDLPPGEKQRPIPSGIMRWRGSMVYSLEDPYSEHVPSPDELMRGLSTTPVLPIIHPAAIMRQWPLLSPTVHDLSARVPKALANDWRPRHPPVLIHRPTFDQVVARLETWLRTADSTTMRLAEDIETIRDTSLITCVGFASSTNYAICIPFVYIENGRVESFWTIEQEARIIELIRRINSHPNILIEGQNFIYDIQFFQHWMGVTPNLDFDTMLAHHLCFPGTRKGLDHLSSMYCDYHWYWKEDSKDWSVKGNLDLLLKYNCLDCIRTFEVADTLRTIISKLNLDRQWQETMRRNSLALRMMNRGIRIDRNRRALLASELVEKQEEAHARLLRIIPQELVDAEMNQKNKTPWYNSNKQQKVVFGDMLGMKLPLHPKTKQPTLGKDGLDTLRKKHPEFVRIFDLMTASRSLGVFYSHFVRAGLDPDGRMRCSFNPSGTETFRWSSSKNVFGRGANLQTIPEGTEE